MSAPIPPQSEYTPEEWRLIMRNAHDALAANPQDEEARAALQEAIPQIRNLDAQTSHDEMQAARDPGGLASFGLGFSQGSTFGLGDEAAALIAGGGALLPGGQSPGEAFRSQLQETREATQGAHESRPLTTLAGDVTGALGTIIPGLGAAGARAGTYLAGQGARIGLPRAGRIAGRLAGGGITGAGYAGLSEAGRSEGGVGERLQAGAEAVPAGAAIGATLGAGAPFAAELGRSLGRKAASMAGLGPSGWVRRGFNRLAGPAEQAAPKAKPKAKPKPSQRSEVKDTDVVRRSLERPRATRVSPKPGDKAPFGGTFVEAGPHQKAGSNVRVRSRGAPKSKDAVDRVTAQAQLESIPTEQLQQAKALASGNKELLRMIEREIRRRAAS